jgi:hypothetical protein
MYDKHKGIQLLRHFIHSLPDKTVNNGYTDSRQVLIYYSNGEEIARSENGHITYTPKFKELCRQLVDKAFEDAANNTWSWFKETNNGA